MRPRWAVKLTVNYVCRKTGSYKWNVAFCECKLVVPSQKHATFDIFSDFIYVQLVGESCIILFFNGHFPFLLVARTFGQIYLFQTVRNRDIFQRFSRIWQRDSFAEKQKIYAFTLHLKMYVAKRTVGIRQLQYNDLHGYHKHHTEVRPTFIKYMYESL